MKKYHQSAKDRKDESRGMKEYYAKEGDFGHGANEMYRVSTESEKSGLKREYEYKPGNMGYPPEAMDYEY
jgi:hypothetical protein